MHAGTVEIPWSTDQTRFEESGLTRLYSCVCMQSLIFLENYALPLSFVFDLRLIGILVVKHCKTIECRKDCGENVRHILCWASLEF